MILYDSSTILCVNYPRHRLTIILVLPYAEINIEKDYCDSNESVFNTLAMFTICNAMLKLIHKSVVFQFISFFYFIFVFFFDRHTYLWIVSIHIQKCITMCCLLCVLYMWWYVVWYNVQYMNTTIRLFSLVVVPWQLCRRYIQYEMCLWNGKDARCQQQTVAG